MLQALGLELQTPTPEVHCGFCSKRSCAVLHETAIDTGCCTIAPRGQHTDGSC